MRSKNKIQKDDPNLLSLFEAHCRDGWSVHSFCGKLQGARDAFNFLRKHNKEFAVLVDKYLQESKKNTSMNIIGAACNGGAYAENIRRRRFWDR